MEKQFAQTERNTNLEILRIISMVLIVMSHSDDWMGLAGLYSKTVCLNKFITDWLHLGGQIGVGCFLLISGYFMVDKQITLKKIMRILGEVWFYTISIWLIFLAVGILNGSCDWKILLKEGLCAFFPFLFSHYWFVTAYIILMILSPFFNKLISVFDKRTYQFFLFTIIIIFVIIDGGIPKTLQGMSEGRLIPVFIMYYIAGYIKKYVTGKKNNARKHIAVSVFMYFLLYLSCVVIGTVGDMLNSETIIAYCYFWRPLNSPVVVVICVELFLGFLRLSPRGNKIVYMIAKSTFGIYLLHCNRIISKYLLPRLFPVYKETNSLLLLIYSAGSVVTVFAVCSAIDLVRSKTVEKTWNRFLDKYLCNREEKIECMIKKAYVSCQNILHRYYQ